MKKYNENNNYTLYQGSMLDMLEVIELNSIDSIITDPPYGLTSITKRFGKENSAPVQYGTDGAFSRLSKGFMGKEWDGSGIEYNIETWQKCYEVLKPGGYLLAFGGSRTYHRIACAIEDAGFEIRDCIMWLYGSGFPKSMDISKQIDKHGGNSYTKQFSKDLKEAREKRNLTMKYCDDKYCNSSTNWSWYEGRKDGSRVPDYETFLKICEEFPELEKYKDLIKECEREVIGKKSYTNDKNIMNISNYNGERVHLNITTPSSNLAKQWQGWGTCLKPAYEPIIIARKPFKGSLVDNVIEYGVGGLNIDECRISYEKTTNPATNPLYRQLNKDKYKQVKGGELSQGAVSWTSGKNGVSELGRFPANVIHDCLSEEWSRYFKECNFNEKDDEIWKKLLVNNVAESLEIIQATKDNIVQMNVEDLLKELKDHYAKYVENQQDLIEISIVQDIVKMLTWDFKIETSQVIQDFIINSKKCIQFLNLVQFVEKMDNIDTTQTTQNLLKLFGYVKVVITNYIQGNLKVEQSRYLYTPKASKKDRDEGLNEFESNKVNDGRQTPIDNPFQRGETPRKNTHPTVKPTELMQYLVRLVTPKGGTILDPFMGSGSTGKAVMYENKERNANYKFIGIELTEEYLPIAEARIEYAKKQSESDRQMSIYDEV